jgi:predicted lipid-binding transport protein (Tim44 family)
MKAILALAIAIAGLALASADADAAKRFGGGGNLGKQRSAPTAPAARDATTSPAAPSAVPAKPAATPGTPAPQPSFMSRWGGLLAGLGIGAVLASLFGAQMGPIVGLVLAGLLAFVVLAFVTRLLMGRSSAPALAAGAPGGSSGVRFPSIGSGLGGSASSPRIEPAIGDVATKVRAIAPADVEPFLRVAKTSFIRMQAANDAGDLDDIRDYTTPEMYAEIAMQVAERGAAAQKTEVVDLEAELLDDAVEGDYAWASVRFTGSTREAPGAAPEPFDEVWNVRKNLRERDPVWLIAGIQQFPLAA